MIHLFNRNKHFDVFISYRNDETRHGSLLARAIAQEFTLRGYKVFYDAWYVNKIKWDAAIPISDNYVVLLTDYSFEVRKQNEQEDENKENEKGKKFRNEVTQILDRVKNREQEKPEWKGEALWLDVDQGYSSYLDNMIEKKEEESDLDEGIKKEIRDLNDRIKEEVTYVPFMTHNKKNLINENFGEKKSFRKFPLIKRSTWMRLGKWMTSISLLLAIALVWCGIRLAQYKEPTLMFLGGGTCKNFIYNKKGVDVSNYGPNSIYVHLPSSYATSILWDEINDSSSYIPLVLTADEIDTLKVNANRRQRFIDNSRRILQYKLGSVNLLVQLRNNKEYSTGDTITKAELIGLLNDPAYKCYSTAIGSGTYNRYVTLLGLRNNENKFTEFAPEDFEANVKTPQIYLANEEYAIEDTGIVSLKFKMKESDTTTEKLDLYVYSIGKIDASGKKYLPQQPVMEFVKKLKLSIEDNQYVDKKSLVVKL